MSRQFTVKYGGKRCPHCKKAIEPGETAQFESVHWPWGNPVGTSPRDLKMWHYGCVNQAMVEGLCEGCGLLHKDRGMCLI